MRKKWKRLLSFLLVLSLLILPMPFNVKADEAIPDTQAIPGAGVTRYTVLVLDVSGSMSGTPLMKLKEAAKSFCEAAAKANGTNKVAIVPYASSVQTPTSFTNDLNVLTNSIEKLKASGNTYTEGGLIEAGNLLTAAYINNYDIKNIILCSDGYPNVGNTTSNMASSVRKIEGINIYTLGFFHNSGSVAAKQLMRDLAYGEGTYNEVTNVEDIIFVFDDLAGKLIGDYDPIIVIPGMMGSNLYSNAACTEQVWPPLSLNKLDDKLNNNKTLYVKRWEDQQPLVSDKREYGASNAYQDIVDALCEPWVNTSGSSISNVSGSSIGEDSNEGEPIYRKVYFFNYDWRKSNKENAERLKQCIEDITKQEEVDSVDLLCHSTGGLIASEYYNSNSKDGKLDQVDKIITCGTPYEGVPKMINSVQNWNIWSDLVTANEALETFLKGDPVNALHILFNILLTDAKSSYPSVAEMAPTKNYVSEIPMQKRDLLLRQFFGQGDTNLTYDEYVTICKDIFGSKNYEDAMKFQSSITKEGEDGAYNVLLSYNNAYFVLGGNRKTISSIKFAQSKINKNKFYESDIEYDTLGDGIVPYFSSSISEQIKGINKSRWAMFDADHGELVSNNDCIDWIKNKLISVTPGDHIDESSKEGYTVIRIACPVDITVTKNGETISSADGKNSFASFGRMDIIGEKDEIKMICVDTKALEDVSLSGTGDGTMDCDIRFYDGESNELLDERAFENVPISSKTDIEVKLGSSDSDSTVLNVDHGDGTSETWTANKGEGIKSSDSEPRVRVQSVSLAGPKNNVLYVGDTQKIDVVKKPANANVDVSIQYKSSDSNVIAVSKNGTLTALKEGTATISVTSLANNNLKDEIVIDVKPVEAYNTGIYDFNAKSALAELDDRILYVNGGTIKIDATTKVNSKQKTYYTNIEATNTTTTVNGKEKTIKGKVLVGLSNSKDVAPSIVNGKIQQSDEMKKIASATISKGKIKLTAKGAGEAYLWVVDTGDAENTACARIVVKAAPNSVQLFTTKSDNAEFYSNKKNVYKKDTIVLGGKTDLYVYATYKDNKVSKETTDVTYTASIAQKGAEYFSVQADSNDPNHFTVHANKLDSSKPGKKVSAKVTITCDQNGKKATFTATAVNNVTGITLTEYDNLTNSTTSEQGIIPLSIQASSSEAKTGSFKLSYSLNNSSFATTDSVKIYAMKTKDGFDAEKWEKGTVKITQKPEGDQKKITAKLGKDKTTVTITAQKGIPDGTSVYYLVFCNSNSGYQIIKVTANNQTAETQAIETQVTTEPVGENQSSHKQTVGIK